MEFFIKIKPGRDKFLITSSRLKLNMYGREVDCKVLRVEENRLYLEPSEKDEGFIKSLARGNSHV